MTKNLPWIWLNIPMRINWTPNIGLSSNFSLVQFFEFYGLKEKSICYHFLIIFPRWLRFSMNLAEFPYRDIKLDSIFNIAPFFEFSDFFHTFFMVTTIFHEFSTKFSHMNCLKTPDVALYSVFSFVKFFEFWVFLSI